VVSTLTRDGSAVTFSVVTIKGVDYVSFPATAGNYIATYAVDSTAPTITTVEPANGATDVSTVPSVKVTFNEAMDASTISTSTIELRTAGNALVASTVTYNASTRTATLVPSASLAVSSTYTVTVKGGSTDPRVKDLSGNALAANSSATFTTWATPLCNPCSIWSTSTLPGTPAVTDPSGVELGVKFRADADGYITGVRFYKAASNTGTHIGSLWTAAGAPLASATFVNESPSGWQEVTFAAPIPVTANSVYVASYYAPNGNYAGDAGYFTSAGTDSLLLHALSDSEAGGNGVYSYGTGSTFPGNTYSATNYWVDVLYTGTSGADTTAPTVTAVSPTASATGVSTSATVSATFSEAMTAASFTTSTAYLRDPSNATVAATVSYSVGTKTVTLTPSAALATDTTYTATIKGGTAPSVTDAAGNALAANYTWSFTTGGAVTCNCTIWPSTATPAVIEEADSNAVQLGVKFRSDVAGMVTGIRFYKGGNNTGTHIGSLFNAAGSKLASATFINETASGWQQVNFASPVAIQANTTYVAAYYTPSGRYLQRRRFASASYGGSVLHA
jgi:hypothetical protein